MKRTLFLTIDFPPMSGGVANYWANLLDRLPADKVVVLAPECDNSLAFDKRQNYVIYRANLLSRNSWLWPKWLPLLWHTWRLVKKEHIEQIIVTHILPVGTVALVVKKLFGVPYYVSCHGLDVNLALAVPHKRRLAIKIASSAQGFIANSQYTADKLKVLHASLADKTVLIYPCPNIHPAPSVLANDEDFEKKHELVAKKVVLTIGRLIPRKGQDKVIAAWPKVLAAVPNAVYLIVGAGADLGRLQEAAADAGVGGSVKFFTDIKDEELPYFYRAANVFIMPAREQNADVEGFGIVYLEANAFGKPVIAGNAGGAIDAVLDQQTGILVDPVNEQAIALSLIELLQNPEKATALGKAGAERVAQEFSWETQARKLLKFLNNS